MKNKALIPILIVVFAAAGFFVWDFLPRPDNQAAENQLPAETIQEGQNITVRGTIVCLPHKNSDGPQTLECAYGLKADNKYYGLADLEVGAWETYKIDQSVEVTGRFAKAGEEEKYNIIGTISVETIVSLSEATDPESEIQGYTNNEYGFSLEFSADFIKLSDDENTRLPWSYGSARAGRRLLTLQLPQAFMPKTNFADGSVTIGVSADKAEVGGCTIGDTEPANVRNINGTNFTELDFSDAGAGNFYATKSYRVVRGDVCLALEATIHSTNLANYSPEQGIVEFDKSSIDAALDEVIQSFTFNK